MRHSSLKDLLAEEGFDIPVTTIILFSNSKIHVQNKCTQLKTCFLKQLNYLIEDFDSEDVLTDRDMDSIADRICASFDHAMENVKKYFYVTGHYPTFNATVGKESLKQADQVIDFFTQFGTRVTFSRMIGQYGISLNEYREFLDKAEKRLSVRRGGNDCTMYGGKCGAGINNYFFANGWVYYCGNCIDLSPITPSSATFFELEKQQLYFDRNHCYKESL